MYSVSELAELFDYGAQMYGQLSKTQAPTKSSIKKITSTLKVKLPDSFIEFANISKKYSIWFASLGEDYDNPFHILKVNSLFHNNSSSPKYLVAFNLGYDGDYDCFDTRTINQLGEHPLVYYSLEEISEKEQTLILLEKSFIAYLTKYSLKMKDEYDIYLKKKVT